MSLTNLAMKSGFWISALKITTKGMGLLRVVILARILTPNDFGIMAVVLLGIEFLYRISKISALMALVQKKGDIEDYLGTAWLIMLARGALMFLILFFAAPAIATFFNNPAAAQYIRVAAFSPLVIALGNPRLVELEREMEFNKKFMYEVVGTLVDISVSITMAFIFQNVWALVFGLLAGNISQLIFSYFIVRGSFRVNFDMAKAVELFHFGKWVLMSGILGFFSGKIGDIILGRLISVAALGHFQMAGKIASLIPGELAFVGSQVLFPAYSKIKDDMGRFRNAVFRVAQFKSIIGLPIVILTCYFAPEIVAYILGNKWLDTIPIIRIISINMLFDLIGTSFGPIFLSQGRTDIVFKLQIYSMCILFPTMYILTANYGAVGTAAAYLVTKLFVFPVSRTIVFRMMGCSFFDYLKWIKEPVIASLGMVGVLSFSQHIIPAQHPFVKTIAQFLLAVGSYYGILIVLLRQGKSELVNYLSWSGLKGRLAGRVR